MIGVRTDDELYAMFTDGIARLDFFKLYKRRTKAAAAATAYGKKNPARALPSQPGNGEGGREGSLGDRGDEAGRREGGREGGREGRRASFESSTFGLGGGGGKSVLEPAQVAFGEVLRELLLEVFWYGDGVFLMDTEHFRRRLLSNIGEGREGGKEGGREGGREGARPDPHASQGAF
jgi:hypothetical protein